MAQDRCLVSQDKLDFLKSFGCDTSGFVIQEHLIEEDPSAYHCQCGEPYCVDDVTSDFVCIHCGSCCYDPTSVHRVRLHLNGSIAKSKQYEPSKYVLEKLR
jgi:hypothetical protein